MKLLISFLKKCIKYLLFLLIILSLFLGAIFLWGYILYSESYDTPLTKSQVEAVELIRSQNDIFVTDSWSIRRTGNTLMSIPEWYIVSISDDYTRFLELGNNPSDFPYFSYINDYWKMYGAISHILDTAWVPRDSEYHTMVRVIGISTALEFSIKGIYENTLGRLVGYISGYATSFDRSYTQISRAYVDFILLRPWYEYDFTHAYDIFSSEWVIQDLRTFERYVIYGFELRLKSFYAHLIEDATHKQFALPDQYTTLSGSFISSSSWNTDPKTIFKTELKIPRYYPFTQTYPDLLRSEENRIDSIAGNKIITTEYKMKIRTENALLSIPSHIDPQITRSFYLDPIDISNQRMHTFPAFLSHIYDF